MPFCFKVNSSFPRIHIDASEEVISNMRDCSSLPRRPRDTHQLQTSSNSNIRKTSHFVESLPLVLFDLPLVIFLSKEQAHTSGRVSVWCVRKHNKVLTPKAVFLMANLWFT
jgi:hypothetical protein